MMVRSSTKIWEAYPNRDESVVGWDVRKKVTFALKIISVPFALCFSTVEADEEMKESETSRDLNEDEKKEKPSEIMGSLEKGLSAIANMMSDEIDV